MSEEVVIGIQGVYKDFKLPHQKVNSIKSIFTGIHKKRTKSFETQHALKDISFEVKKGEFFGIVGRNGSGKSTLLKIIAEIYQPTKGTLQKSGKLVPFIELGVGFNPELTGRENVYLNGALLGFSEKEIDEQYDGIVEFAELEPFMDQKLKNYSSGMQVRLAFSVATRAKADILLIDEVLAVGDAAFQRKCFDFFKELKKSGTTVIFVSHDMTAVKEYCDRAILIENSELVTEGNPDDIARDYTQLFNIQDNTEDNAKDSTRWGDGKVTYEAVVLSRDKITDGTNELSISATAIVNEKITSPVFGFTVTAPDGRQLLGTNTKILGKKTATYKPGDRLTLTWHVPNIFSDGLHTVDVAVSHEDAVTISDWWEDVARFRVAKTKKTPYPVNPSIGVVLK